MLNGERLYNSIILSFFFISTHLHSKRKPTVYILLLTSEEILEHLRVSLSLRRLKYLFCEVLSKSLH